MKKRHHVLTMDPLDFDEDDLHETRAERRAYDEELQGLLLESWEKQDTARGGSPAEGIAGHRASTAIFDGADATPPIVGKPQEVDPAEKTVIPQGVILPGNSLLIEPHPPGNAAAEKPATNKDAAKTRYLQQLGKRVNSTSGISRSQTMVEISEDVLERSTRLDVKGKKKAPSLPAPIPLSMDPPFPPSTSKFIAPPHSKPIRVSPKLQVVLDNHANFLLAIQSGARPKMTRRKGLLTMDKLNLARLTTVFDGCVVAVVHHLSAKPEQLVTRWTLVG